MKKSKYTCSNCGRKINITWATACHGMCPGCYGGSRSAEKRLKVQLGDPMGEVIDKNAEEKERTDNEREREWIRENA